MLDFRRAAGHYPLSLRAASAKFREVMPCPTRLRPLRASAASKAVPADTACRSRRVVRRPDDHLTLGEARHRIADRRTVPVGRASLPSVRCIAKNRGTLQVRGDDDQSVTDSSCRTEVATTGVLPPKNMLMSFGVLTRFADLLNLANGLRGLDKEHVGPWPRHTRKRPVDRVAIEALKRRSHPRYGR